MKRNLRKPLIGAGSLILTIAWSVMALTGPPELPIDTGRQPPPVAGPACSNLPAAERAAPLAAGNDSRQDVNPAQSVPRSPALVVIEQDLLAKAGFPDGGPAGESQWLNGCLQRLAGEQDPADGPGGHALISDPLSLFLLGTGMFGLAAFKRRWRK